MAAPKQHLGGSKPSRSKTAVGYTPLEEQGSPLSIKVHSLPQARFTSSSQAALGTPATVKSWRSTASALSAAAKRLSWNIEMGKETLKSKLTAVKTAMSKKDKKGKGQLSRSSSSSSKDSSSTTALSKRERLPRLQIPKLHAAVDEALNSACSTDTQKSDSFKILEMTPTSRDLQSEWLGEHPPDVVAEFHNMFSARRRVRKGKFGTLVDRYQRARPTWDDRWGLRMENDNHDDRILLRHLTEALQEQKDYATRLVQKNPGPYPGLEAVSAPGCTLPLYWQGKSSYKKIPTYDQSRSANSFQ
ncbi:hypothetical protein F4680DRAFT_467500 [Xylaria scruposa]|nr:hypothetical protein F4680DRAFT_467500 [Xylaria scruposa]